MDNHGSSSSGQYAPRPQTRSICRSHFRARLRPDARHRGVASREFAIAHRGGRQTQSGAEAVAAQAYGFELSAFSRLSLAGRYSRLPRPLSVIDHTCIIHKSNRVYDATLISNVSEVDFGGNREQPVVSMTRMTSADDLTPCFLLILARRVSTS